VIFRTFFLARAAFRVHSGFSLLAFGFRFFHCRLQNQTVVPRVARFDGAVDYQLLWRGFNLGMCSGSQCCS
jgi:hypothetical protein